MRKSTVPGLLVLGGLAYALSGGEGLKAPAPTSLPTPSQTYRAAEPAWASLAPLQASRIAPRRRQHHRRRQSDLSTPRARTSPCEQGQRPKDRSSIGSRKAPT